MYYEVTSKTLFKKKEPVPDDISLDNLTDFIEFALRSVNNDVLCAFEGVYNVCFFDEEKREILVVEITVNRFGKEQVTNVTGSMLSEV